MAEVQGFDIDEFVKKHKLGTVTAEYRKGIKHQHALDAALPETIQGILDDVAPDFGKLIVEYVFAGIYARPGLDMKYRIIAT